jgi:phosphatidylglycerophosphate synthase
MNAEIKPGNKLPEYYDDPIDLFYKRYIDIINPHFKDAGMTPNMITTISLAFGLLTCYLYYKSYYISAGLAYIVSYFFDTMDGYFARIYDMGSVFGSYYDSISDNAVALLLLILFYKNPNVSGQAKIAIFLILIIYGFGTAYHMSCQEKYVKQTNEKHVSEGLAFLDKIKCSDSENMRYSRFFGTGVTTLVMAFIISSHVFLTKK